MTELSAQTLMVAIKAVHDRANRVEAEAREAEDDYLAQQELLDISKAETELRKAYEAVQRESDNLPLYSRLIGAG
jgi:hypothetical protein